MQKCLSFHILEVPRSDVHGVQYLTFGVPYHMTYPMMHLMLPSPHEQTDACEYITFPQRYLQAVKIIWEHFIFIFTILEILRNTLR